MNIKFESEYCFWLYCQLTELGGSLNLDKIADTHFIISENLVHEYIYFTAAIKHKIHRYIVEL